jgi:hypothetical protein
LSDRFPLGIIVFDHIVEPDLKGDQVRPPNAVNITCQGDSSMMPVPCPSCGARSTGQEPFYPSCGATRVFTAPPPEQPLFVSVPPVLRRRLGWKALLVGLVLSLVVVGTLASVLAGFGLFDWLGKAALLSTTGPGWWKATAPGLGSFEFHLNNDRTAISDFAFQIPQISCPSITYSVSDVQVSNDPPGG